MYVFDDAPFYILYLRFDDNMLSVVEFLSVEGEINTTITYIPFNILLLDYIYEIIRYLNVR